MSRLKFVLVLAAAASVAGLSNHPAVAAPQNEVVNSAPAPTGDGPGLGGGYSTAAFGPASHAVNGAPAPTGDGPGLGGGY